MAMKSYVPIWNLLDKYNFDIDNQKYTDLLCVICKNILNNPYRSLCECSYCFKCFEKYISVGEKYCPGKCNGCKQEIVDVLKSIHVYSEAVDKISQIIVKCPIEFCNFNKEIKFIPHHILFHQSKPSIEMSNSTELLMNYFDEVRLEMNMFSLDFEKTEELTSKVHSEIIEMQTLQAHENENRNCLSDKLIERNNKLNDIQLKIKTLLDNQEIEIDKLKQEQKESHLRNRQLTEELQNAKEQLSSIQDKLQKQNPILKIRKRVLDISNFFQNRFIEIKEGFTQLKQNLDDSNHNENITCLQRRFKCFSFSKSLLVESLSVFEWQIVNLSMKRVRAKFNVETEIRSETFYSHSNGYKMQLVLFPNGIGSGISSHVSVGLLILEGKYDKLLTWPMDFGLFVELIDQVENESKVLTSFNYRNLKPSFERFNNTSFLTSYRVERFIDYNWLNSLNLAHKDAIILRCRVG